jgi:hypothetical protein
MKTTTAHVVCATTLAVCLLAVSPASVSAQTPIGQPLLQASDMRYLGSFPLPVNDGTGADEGRLTFGGFAPTINPATQTLILAGHDWYSRLCEVQLPSGAGQVAPIVQPCTDVTEGRLGLIDRDSIKIGGTLVWNGRLIVSAYAYYDADGNAQLSHFASGLNFGVGGDVQGPFQVGTAGAGFVSGYMGVVPEEWRALFGGPALTGQCCLSIISRSSSGPSVSVFNPDDVGRVSPVPATTLLGYPLSHPLAPNDRQNELFNNATNITGVAFPSGTRSVLFIGRQGLGPYCYGEGAACGDPVSSSKGTHAYPYVLQVWAYDANELLAVKLGLREPWSVRPYATWRLPEFSTSGGDHLAGATYDPATRRLYVVRSYGESPRVHAYLLGNGTGGVVLPLPSAPRSLTGSVHGSAVSLSWTPPVGAPWAGYVVEAGSAPGASDIVQLPLNPTTTTVSSPVPPGRYYVRVRAFNAQPAAGPPSNEVVLTVGAPASPAAKPQNFRVSVAGTAVTLSWSPPPAGEVVHDYLLDAGTAPGASNIANSIPLGAGFVVSVPGVPPGTYYVRIRARNALGVSVPSDEAAFTVTSPAAPGAPTGLHAQVDGSRTITLSWSPPSSGGPTTSYVLEAGTAAGASQIAGDVGAPTSVALPGVPPGTYHFRVRAKNALGVGAASADARVTVR